jgi:hypothetical protein
MEDQGVLESYRQACNQIESGKYDQRVIYEKLNRVWPLENVILDEISQHHLIKTNKGSQ